MVSGSISFVFIRNFEISAGIVIWIPNGNHRPYTNNNIVEDEIEIPELNVTRPTAYFKVRQEGPADKDPDPDSK